jgi:thiol-disulfide isomerase/thioredoxin
MKYIKFLFYLSPFFFGIGCTSSTETTISDVLEEPAQKANQVVLIFDKAPQNSRYTWPDGTTSLSGAPPYEIRYIDDYCVVRNFTPKLAPEKDTLILKTEREIVEVQHAYLGIDNFSYLFEKGDSVLFTYEGRKPTARVLNRTHLPWDINFELRKRALISKDSFPGVLRIQSRFAFRDPAFHHIDNLHERTEIARRVGYRAAIAEYLAEHKLLDSLKEHSLISSNIYSFYKKKSSFDLSNQQFFFPLSAPLPGDSILIPADELRTAINELNTQYFYANLTLASLRDHYFSSKADLITTSNARYRDYRQVYDTIRASTLFTEHGKKLLLFNTIDDLLNVFSLVDRVAYWQKFRKDVPDSALINYISNKYHLDKEISNELQLKTLNDDGIDFANVLARYPNKVIYVDFWASWCAPCIRALPASKELHEAYKNEEVVFLYLSLDEDSDKWKQAAQKYKLNDSLSSYVAENQHTSRMLDDLQVKSIPRYLLYDKQGNLVHKNAPGPGSEEAKKLINKYLGKEGAKVSTL